MKPGPNFKLPKSVKRIMATIVNDHERGSYKRSMIEAELYSTVKPPKEKNKKSFENKESEE
jgi:hypothetical protein